MLDGTVNHRGAIQLWKIADAEPVVIAQPINGCHSVVQAA
jgi:hypothetical protein